LVAQIITQPAAPSPPPPPPPHPENEGAFYPYLICHFDDVSSSRYHPDPPLPK